MSQFVSKRTSRRPDSGGGFTLIEMIAVLVLTAILAAVAVPSLASMGETRTALAGAQLLRDVTFARQRAVATGSRSWIEVDPAAESYTLKAESLALPGRSNATVLTDPGTGRPFVQTLGVDPFPGVGIASAAFDGGTAVGFDWKGRPLDGNELDLDAAGSITLTGGCVVTVHPGTGHATRTGP
jgi:MSHA pilin protein MshC